MTDKPEKYNLLTKELGLKLKRQALFLLKIDRRIKWMGAGMFCFALFSVLSFFPEFTERYYSQGLFIAIRYIYDYTLGLLPFSTTIWLNLIFFLWFSYKIFKYIRFNINNRQVSIWNRTKYTALAAMSFLGKLSVLFFIGWGFNYQRIPIETYTNIGIQPLRPQEILVEANIARKLTVDAREMIPELPDDKPFDESFLPGNLEKEMRNNLSKVLKHMGYPAPGRVRCRVLQNDYWLKEIGYAGMYVSFYGEAIISDNISPLFRPFYYAHEMAHAFGFFDEADANFLAYLACEQSDNPSVVYSGRLAHLIYIKHEFKIFSMGLPSAIKTDVQSRGVISSDEEYNRMILLVKAWRKKYPLKITKPIQQYPKSKFRNTKDKRYEY